MSDADLQAKGVAALGARRKLLKVSQPWFVGVSSCRRCSSISVTSSTFLTPRARSMTRAKPHRMSDSIPKSALVSLAGSTPTCPSCSLSLTLLDRVCMPLQSLYIFGRLKL